MGLASPNRSRYAFGDVSTLRWDYTTTMPGALVELSLAGAGSCELLAAKEVWTVAVADEALAWVEYDYTETAGTRTLWLQSTPGDTPRALGSMANIAAPIFIAPNTLEVQLGHDLAWLDVRDDPVQMHYVAEKVFRIPAAGPRWFVVGYDLNSQDLTGTLGMVDWHTGEKHPISPSVADFITSSVHSSDRPLNIVYLVRGRSPSPQDGIWAATIEADDLP